MAAGLNEASDFKVSFSPAVSQNRNGLEYLHTKHGKSPHMSTIKNLGSKRAKEDASRDSTEGLWQSAETDLPPKLRALINDHKVLKAQANSYKHRAQESENACLQKDRKIAGLQAAHAALQQQVAGLLQGTDRMASVVALNAKLDQKERELQEVQYKLQVVSKKQESDARSSQQALTSACKESAALKAELAGLVERLQDKDLELRRQALEAKQLQRQLADKAATTATSATAAGGVGREAARDSNAAAQRGRRGGEHSTTTSGSQQGPDKTQVALPRYMQPHDRKASQQSRQQQQPQCQRRQQHHNQDTQAASTSGTGPRGAAGSENSKELHVHLMLCILRDPSVPDRLKQVVESTEGPAPPLNPSMLGRFRHSLKANNLGVHPNVITPFIDDFNLPSQLLGGPLRA